MLQRDDSKASPGIGTGAALILGGLLTLNLVSSATVGALRLASEAKRVKKLKNHKFFAKS